MKKILIIDDDESSRNLIKQILLPIEYQIITANNGIEGIRKALRHHPDLITLDVEMPYVNGFAMMKILTIMHLRIPTIFVTSREDIHQYIEKYPDIIDACQKSVLKTNLLEIATKILSNKNRPYFDLDYTLTQREILELLGKSDRKKLLVVDPSTQEQERMIRILEATELYEIYQAENGQEALIKSVLIKPDLILTEIALPKINGISLAQILYIVGYPFSLVFISSKKNILSTHKIKKLEGVRGYLEKEVVLAEPRFFRSQIEELSEITEKDKEKLQVSYKGIDFKKLVDSAENKELLGFPPHWQ